jgi:long-chain acyl-CoA synthetase
LKQAAISAFGQSVVVEFYGSTEGQFTVCPVADWQTHPGTVGRARPGRELRITEGQIWCRAPDFARFEYWGDPEKTASAWDGDWFTVGDLGRLDNDGFLYLEGRRSDLIISGGVNVYPAEVERVLRGLAGLRDVSVFGIPDEQWGHRVCAAVAGTVSEQQVRQYANEHLAPYKRPKTILMVTDLPITHSGKVDRSRLLALLRGE